VLAQLLFRELGALRHGFSPGRDGAQGGGGGGGRGQGGRVVKVYGSHASDDASVQGGVVTFR
jgi:hypothetical protein